MISYLISHFSRYLARLFLFWFLACLAGFMIVIALFEGTELARRSLGKPQIHLSFIMEMILLKLPTHIQVLLPFIMLFTTIITFWRLNSTRELIAARAAGISIWQLLLSMILIVVLIGAIQLIVLNPIGAALNTRAGSLELLYFNSHSNHLAVSETGLWLKEAMPDRHTILHAARIDGNRKAFVDTTFHNYTPDDRYQERIDAQVAILEPHRWHLQQATVWDATHAPTVHSDFYLDTQLTMEKIQESNAAPESISFWQIPNFINILENSGLSSLTYRLYWHGQMAKIAMMVGMLLLAATFSLRPVRQGRTFILISLGAVSGFLVHFANDVVYALGLADEIPVILATWAPSIMVVFSSTALLLHLEDG